MSDERRSAPPDGALTDATGSLTPEPGDEEFVPAERRALEHPEQADAVGTGSRRRRIADAHPIDDPGGLARRPLEEIHPNDRDGGYGSEHGLAADDPAYDFAERREAPDAEADVSR